MTQFIDPSELMFTNFEPNTNWRFHMIIDGIPSFLIQKTDMPNPTSGKLTIPHINKERYVKGKTKWDEISITLMDSIVPSAAQIAMEWFRLSHEAVTGRDGYFDMYAKDITIQILGPVGDIVREWTLKGAWVTNIKQSSRDWGSEDYSNIDLTIAYNYAILQY